MTASRLFLSPGFFGFSRVGSYDYFSHLCMRLERWMRDAGREVTSHGTDAVESMGPRLIEGNNVSINLEPDSREDTDRLHEALAEGGKPEMPLADMFWGAYFGTVVDKLGTRWMFNFTPAK